MTTPNFIGFDFGGGAVKTANRQHTITVQSAVAAVGHSLYTGEERANKPAMLEDDSGRYYIGTRAHQWGVALDNVDLRRFEGTPSTRALFRRALAAMQERLGNDAPYHLMLGLPVEFLTGDDAKAQADKVRAWMMGEHTFTLNGKARTVRVERVGIMSQPSGALGEYLLDDEGDFQRPEHIDSEIGVLNIGATSVDLFVSQRGVTNRVNTRGAALGARQLYNLLDADGNRSLAEMDEAMRDGTLQPDRAHVDAWATMVAGHIDRVWGARKKRWELLILAGGGVHLLKDAFSGINRTVYVPRNPVMSTAVGLYRHMAKIGKKE